MNDRDLAVAVVLSPLGDYAFVGSQGSNTVDVFDVYTGRTIVNMGNVGRAPQGLVLSGDARRLFVHSFLSRTVSVWDIGDVMSHGGSNVTRLADVSTVSNERLSSEVLAGKRIFYNADDRRMNEDGYISCASCHLDGGSDGRVWDFTDRGEGLRNTITLNGRRGTGHGRVHWSANFDEIQDFEHDIRGPFGGDGFRADADFNTGTRNDPLGDPKAGKALFQQLQCASCHLGGEFTDSALGVVHDVGTIKVSSGRGSGEALAGIDTPSLKGLWNDPPYLHDGSATTVLDVLTTENQQQLHGATGSLSAAELVNLVSYLKQIDEREAADMTPPIIASFAPGAGAVDTEVGIVGDGFTGTVSVEFGGVRSTTFSVDSDTEILARVPQGAVTGRIRIVSPHGIAESANVFVVEGSTNGPTVFEETQSGGSTNSPTVASAAPLSYAAGDLYVAAVAAKSHGAVTGVTGLGGTWTEVATQCSGRQQTGVSVWVTLDASSGGVATATVAGTPNNAAMVVARYSGAAAVAPLVAANTTGVDGAAACAGGVDSPGYTVDVGTSVPGAVVVGAIAMRNRTHTPGAVYAQRAAVAQGSAGGVAAVAIVDQTVAAPGGLPLDGSFNGTVDWAVVAVEIRPGGGGSVNVAPRVAIQAPTDGTSVVAGAITFTGTGTATDMEDDDATLTAALAWTSDLDGPIGTGGTFATATLTVGTHTIMASATDSGGLSASASINVTVTDPPRLDDVAVDFGGAFGVWGLFNNGPSASLHGEALGATPTTLATLGGVTSGQIYAQIHPASPEAMATGDVDGSGQDDMILDFPGAGVWIWLNNSAWVQLHPARPTQMTTGDLDGNGQDEVILDFAGFGVWAWFNNTSWVPLHPANVTGMTVGDLDGSGQSDVIVDFPRFGLWVWSNTATWSPFHPLSARGLATGDLDGNGQDEAVLDFPGFGLWVRQNNSAWVPLHPSSAEAILTADIDGSGQADVIVDFGALGLRA